MVPAFLRDLSCGVYLREGADGSSVEMVQLLLDPALLHVTKRLMPGGCAAQQQQLLLGFLQLDVTHTLLDLPENPSWHFM